MTLDIQDHKIKALKYLGQNFLINEKIVNEIIDAADIKPNDTIVEIGPGKGALTFNIASKAKRLICIERDPRMVTYLNSRINENNIKNTEIVNQNVLRFDSSKLPLEYKVIGSLPFNISKQIIKKFMQVPHQPTSITCVLQKDVAEDYTAEPPNASFLSNFIKIYGSCNYISTIKKGNFRPIPEVDAAVVNIFLVKQPPDHKRMASFTKQIFNKPRKTIKNNLKATAVKHEDTLIEQASTIVELQKRPQELTFEEIQQLFMLYNKLQT